MRVFPHVPPRAAKGQPAWGLHWPLKCVGTPPGVKASETRAAPEDRILERWGSLPLWCGPMAEQTVGSKRSGLVGGESENRQLERGAAIKPWPFRSHKTLVFRDVWECSG